MNNRTAVTTIEMLTCFGELFDALGAELVAVEMHDPVQVGGGADRLSKATPPPARGKETGT